MAEPPCGLCILPLVGSICDDLPGLVVGQHQTERLRRQRGCTTSRKEARFGLSAWAARLPVLWALSSSKRAPLCCSPVLAVDGDASADGDAFAPWSATHHSKPQVLSPPFILIPKQESAPR